MNSELTAYLLRITIQAHEPLWLDTYPGSSLRGALFNSLLRRFCTNPTSRTCAECPLNLTCPVSSLVAPLRDENPRGHDVPRPFVLAPTANTAQTFSASPDHAGQPEDVGVRLAADQTFQFDLTLFGQAARLFPYIALSMPTLESLGMGMRVPALLGRRGRPHVQRIEAIDPFSDRTEPLYTRGEPHVHAPTLAITPAAITARAAALPADRLQLRFLTPMRLTSGGQLVRTPMLSILVRRLLERLDAVEREYGSEPAQPLNEASQDPRQDARPDRRERYLRLSAQAERIHLTQNQTRWVDVASFSARQGRATPIGGLIGEATYQGELTPELRELLVWGEVLHVGKNAVKGDGLYHIGHSPSAPSDSQHATAPATADSTSASPPR